MYSSQEGGLLITRVAIARTQTFGRVYSRILHSEGVTSGGFRRKMRGGVAVVGFFG